jgi:hypothetical protein
MAKCGAIDRYVETLAGDVAAAEEDLDTLHDALYVGAGPHPHAVAKCLVDLAGIRTQLAGLTAIVQEGS